MLRCVVEGQLQTSPTQQASYIDGDGDNGNFSINNVIVTEDDN